MKARELLDKEAGTFGPEAMKIIYRAFDEAWATVSQNYTGVSAQAARMKLATTVLSLAANGSRDVEALKNAALRQMKMRSSSLR